MSYVEWGVHAPVPFTVEIERFVRDTYRELLGDLGRMCTQKDEEGNYVYPLPSKIVAEIVDGDLYLACYPACAGGEVREEGESDV